MYQNCFTAGPFTEMKSTLCQVHRWPRPRAHGSPEAPCTLPLLRRSSGRQRGRRGRSPLHFSLQPTLSPIWRHCPAYNFWHGTTDYDGGEATCNRLHVSGLLHEYTACSMRYRGRRKSPCNAEICGEGKFSCFLRISSRFQWIVIISDYVYFEILHLDYK